MGLTLINKKREMNIGYIGFGYLRMCIASAYNKEFGVIYKKWYNTCITGGLSEQELDRWNEICNDDLDILLNHSDCDGKLTREECKKIYNVLKTIDLTEDVDERFKNKYEELKEMLKDNLTIHFY